MQVYDRIVAAVPQDAALLEAANEHTLRPLSTLGPELQPLAWQLIRRIKQEPDATVVEEVVETIKTAIATGWQDRERQLAENEATRETAPSNGRNGTTPHRSLHRQSNQLGTLSRWANRITSWDPQAIAEADDELRLKRHLKAARQLRTFCEAFIAALEIRLAQ